MTQLSTPYSTGARQAKSFYIIWILILADLLTGLFFNMDFAFYRVGLPLKSLVILLTFFHYLPFTQWKTYASIYILMGILVGIWIIGSFLSFIYNPKFDYAYSTVVLNRYLFFFILSSIFIHHAQSDTFSDTCSSIFDSFLILNNILIFTGLIFGIDIFSTYDPLGEQDIQRFGYKGLIHGGNDIAGIYVLGIAHLYRKNFKYQEQKKIALILTCLAALLTGTKAGLLSVVSISVYYWAAYRTRPFFFLLAALLVVGTYWLAFHWTMVYVQYILPFIRMIESMDVLSYLMSSRNDFIVRNFNFMSSNWSALHFFTGDGFLYSETDLLDLYYFFGLGAVLYLYFYSKIFFIRDTSRDNVYVFIVLLSIAATAGHIMQSTVVPIFLLLYIFSAGTIRDNHATPRNNSHR